MRTEVALAALDTVIEAVLDLTMVEADAVLEATRIHLRLTVGPTTNGSAHRLVDEKDRREMEHAS